MLHEVGEYREAIQQAEVVEEWRERALGPDHPWTKVIREKLARYRDSLDVADRVGPV
ncbi:tetratricopeptide repeat protein [Kitasatospora albolonga]|uniref:tetratricopeptide repeat protein n=1 Tax=Kitasatospora albolonga TaxID=68173 RepID=UPI0031E50F8C